MTTILDGDASLRRRPVARIIEPLRRMGAVLYARRNDSLPPLTVVGHTPLRAIDFETPVPSAQVKSAILLAGLRADGRTTVRESVATRDHTERMLRARGVPVERADDAGQRGGLDGRRRDGGACGAGAGPGRCLGGRVLARRGRHPSRCRADPARRRRQPDPPGGHRHRCARWAPTSRSVGRSGRRDRGRRRGAPTTASASPSPTSSSARRRSAAIDLGPADVAAAIDEIPVLCLAAAFAERHDRHPRRGRAAPQGIGPDRRDRRRAARARRDGSRSTATTSRSTAARPLRGAVTDSLDDHRLAMTFAIAGLVASGQTSIGRPALGRNLLSRLLRRPRKGASMTKRVVLIGHPVAHSLSGAMQQAAFDSLGIDARYETWDRTADRARRRHRRAARRTSSSGANVTIPHKERVVPMVDRLNDDAQPTGAVNTITREGKRLVGHNTDVAGLPGRAGPARRQAEDASPGGRARRRRRRPGRRLRAHHRRLPAGHRLQPAPPSRRSPGQALRPECGAHGAQGDALARIDHRVGAGQGARPRQRDVDRADDRRDARSRPRRSTPTCSCST